MTAITIIKQRDAVHVLTDTAATGRDGAVVAFVSKVHCFPHLRAVVAVRGLTDHIAALPMLGFVPTLEDVVSDAVTFIANAKRSGHELEIYVAGFEGAFAITGGGIQPITAFAITPPPAPGELGDFTGKGPDDLDAAVDGLRILQSQRRNGAAVVGGHAVLTSVHADRIESRVLHTWPDRIGERINP